MATVLLTGNAVSVKKQLWIGLPSNQAVVSGDAEVKIGLGSRLLTFTGWNPTLIAATWSASTDPLLKEVSCQVPTDVGIGGEPQLGSPLVFTHNTAGEDFELTVLINGESLLTAHEIQSLSFGHSPTGGTFTVTFNGTTTASITYNPASLSGTAAAIQAAFVTAGMQAGDITVSVGDDAPPTFLFNFGSGRFAGQDVALITANTLGLTGEDSTVAITVVSTGSTGQDCIQIVELSAEDTEITSDEIQTFVLAGATFTGGSFNLILDGVSSANISYNASSTVVKNRLEAMSNIGVGNVIVTGGPLPYNTVTVHFRNDLAGIDLSELTGNAANLVGSDTPFTVTEEQSNNDTSGINQNADVYKLPFTIPITAGAKLCWIIGSFTVSGSSTTPGNVITPGNDALVVEMDFDADYTDLKNGLASVGEYIFDDGAFTPDIAYNGSGEDFSVAKQWMKWGVPAQMVQVEDLSITGTGPLTSTTSPTLLVVNSAYDGSVPDGGFTPGDTLSELEVGNPSGGTAANIGFYLLFTNVAIQAGAIIQSAVLKLHDAGGDDVEARISARNDYATGMNSAQFYTYGELTTTVDWSIAATDVGTMITSNYPHVSPDDLSELIQEWKDQAGYAGASGRQLTLFVKNNGTADNKIHRFRSYDGSAGTSPTPNVPALEITYAYGTGNPITVTYTGRWQNILMPFDRPVLAVKTDGVYKTLQFGAHLESTGANINQIQKIVPTVPICPGGDITITLDGETTGLINVSPQVTAADIQAALNEVLRSDDTPLPSFVSLTLDSFTGSYNISETPDFAAVLPYPVTEADLDTALAPLPLAGTKYVARWRSYNRTSGKTNIVAETTPGNGITYNADHGIFADNINAAILNASILNNLRLTPFTVTGGPIVPNGTSSPIYIEGTFDGRQETEFDLAVVTYIPALSPGSSGPSVDVDTTQNGGTETVPGITGGFINLHIDPPGSAVFTVSNIAWDSTAGEVQTAINGVMGAGSVSCTGGPFPTDPITIHFQGGYAKTAIPLMVVDAALEGVFSGSYSNEVIRSASRANPTNNTWELTVCPGDGTPGVNFSSATATDNVFYLRITLAEGRLLYRPGGTDINAVEIRFCGLNALMVESIINEAFGEDVCRVTKTVHSFEHRILNLSGYAETGKALAGWYYRDVYRITFINRYADPGSIVDITLIVAHGGSGDPEKFMVLGNGANYDDLTDESARIAYLFYHANLVDKPLHLFQIQRMNEDTPELLTWRFNLETQYILGSQVVSLPRIGIADILSDVKIKFQWCKFIWTNEGTGFETKTYTILGQTPPMDWDSPPEVIRNALERLVYTGSDTPIFFGEGNVSVTGSLFNSWLSDPYQAFNLDLNPDPTTLDYDEAYHALEVQLTGALGVLPFNEYNYELVMVFVDPYDWDLNVAANNPGTNRFKAPLIYSDIIAKPLPLLRNNRQRVTVLDPEGISNIEIRIGDVAIPLNLAASASTIEDALNTQLGQFPKFTEDDDYLTKNIVEGHFVATNPTGIWLPEKWRKAICVFGNTFGTDPMEFEFTGYGYQFQTPEDNVVIGLPGTPPGLITVTMNQTGSALAHAVQTVALTNNPYGGTFRLTKGANTTGDLAYNASAGTVQTALRALASIGAGNVTVTGGPLPAAVTCTFDDSLIPVAAMTSSTVALNNATSSISVTQPGGLDGTLTIREIVRGAGPFFWDSPQNWSTGNVPGSEDSIIFDDATQAIKYGIRQHATFIVCGDDGKVLLTGRRCVFTDRQKVFVYNTGGTLPTGLMEGYAYILNPANDATVYLWDGSSLDGLGNPEPFVLTGSGTGVHHLQVREVSLEVYARYGGGQIGLPSRRTNGAEEYLCEYTEIGFSSIILGTDPGDGLTLGKFDTLDLPCDVYVINTSQGSDFNIPAVLFLFDNADSVYVQDNGSVGIAIYADELSHLKSVEANSGSLVLRNVTVDEDFIDPQGIITVRGASTVGQRINIRS